MTRFTSRPLGIDIGSTRVRVAWSEGDRLGHSRLRAVASRDLPSGCVAADGSIGEPNLIASLITQARLELGVRERRAVTSLGATQATLRPMQFPRMSWLERVRAARFESERFAARELGESPVVVRVHPAQIEGWWSIGVARSDAMAARINLIRGARLRPVAIDHNAIALRRAIGHSSAIVDCGLGHTTLYAFDEQGPRMWTIAGGGADMTRAIARDLTIDYTTAEKRKRILGIAGGGVAARAQLVNGLTSLIETARLRIPITRIALTGNGARLVGLSEALEAACGAPVEIPIARALKAAAYPADVIRSAAADWALAVGLALWATAA